MNLRRNRTPLRLLTVISLSAAIMGCALLAAGVVEVPQAGAYTPVAPWEPLPLSTSAGGLLFFNATGQQITSGKITAQPFAAYAEGTSVLNANDKTATLYAYTPVKGVAAGKWTGQLLGGTTAYPNASAPPPLKTSPFPVYTGAPTDTSLKTYIASVPNVPTPPTNGYADLYVIRLVTSNPTTTTSYNSADIKITGTTWSVVYPTSVTTVSASPSSPQHYGTNVKFTATLTPPAATGSVQFLNRTTDIGTPVTVATGKASITETTLPAGTNLINAVFTPTSSGLYSNSVGNLVYSVTAAPTKTALTTTPTGSQAFGQNVKLTATVTPAVAGNVQFLNGATVLGTKAVSAGTASLTVSTLPVGTLTLTAKFTPTSGNYAKSTGHAGIKIKVSPTITKVTPAAGPAGGGTTVTLTGTNFVSGATTVTFGGTTIPAGSVTFVSTTKIKVTSPPHAAATVTVKATTAGGTSASGEHFTYVAAPTITNVTPAAGSTGGGTTVTLTGTGFVSGATTVTFGGTTIGAGSVTFVSTTQIKVTSPPHAAGAVTVQATTAGGTSASGEHFTYVTGPSITKVTPGAGPTGGGTTVTLSGSGFVSGATSVTFGGTTIPAGSVTFVSSTQIKVTSPPHAAGTVTVKATTTAGTSESGEHFVYGAPTITKVTPPAGPTGGGTTVTLTGSGFVSGATTVTFGGTTIGTGSVTFVSSIQIKVTSPPHAAATVTVKATTAGGTSASGEHFTYVAAPTITNVTPAVGPTGGGTTVTLTGTGYLSGATTVTFGGTTIGAGSVTFVSSTQIKVTSPPHAAATVTVKATTAGGTSASGEHFTYVATPTITKVTPAAGPTGGGTTVTLNGTGFVSGATTVTFGGTTIGAGSVTFVSSTQIKVTSPSHAPGTVTVKATTVGGTSTSGEHFTYEAAPTVASFTPTSGPSSGGTTVVITGTHFTGATSVKFGTTATASFSVTNATHITAKTKAHAAGTVLINVTTPGGTATSTTDYTFVVGPTVTSFTPTSGPSSGGTTVVITGTHFTGATSVKFGTTAAGSFSVTNATHITAKTKAHADTTVRISVTTVGGTGTSATTFSFTAAPVFTADAPPTTAAVGKLYSYTFAASGNPAPTYALSGQPTWLSINSSTGAVTGTPPSGTTSFTYSVKASNGVAPAATAGPFSVTVSSVSSSGYDLVGSDGGVFVFPTGQSSGFFGSLPGLGVKVNNIVGMVPTSTDEGYFLVGSDGGVFAFGTAPFLGSLPGLHVTPTLPIAGIVAANADKGYFLVGKDGGVFAFGTVPFLGSLPGKGISVDNIIGIASTPSGNGYWLVSATGTVYGFGAAQTLGTAKGSSSPVSAIAGTPTGGGYWITTQNGTVYAFGNAKKPAPGTLPGVGVTPAHPVIGIVHTSDTAGYWLIGSDGGIFAFGDAPFVGSLPGVTVHVTNVVGAVPTAGTG